MWRSFFCALVATVTLQTMNPYRTGKLVMFQVSYDRDWHFFEIIFFVLLGIFGVSSHPSESFLGCLLVWNAITRCMQSRN